MQAEQVRIESEIQRIEVQLRTYDTVLSAPNKLSRGLDLLDCLPDTYFRAQPAERRTLNQAIFEGFWVGDRQVRRYEWSGPTVTS